MLASIANLHVLEKVNAGRVAAGLMPLDSIPRGRRASASDCPLAKAFKDLGVSAVNGSRITGLNTKKAFQFASAIGGEVAQHNGEASVVPPREFTNFVAQFDGGLYPELEA